MDHQGKHSKTFSWATRSKPRLRFLEVPARRPLLDLNGDYRIQYSPAVVNNSLQNNRTQRRSWLDGPDKIDARSVDKEHE